MTVEPLSQERLSELRAKAQAAKVMGVAFPIKGDVVLSLLAEVERLTKERDNFADGCAQATWAHMKQFTRATYAEASLAAAQRCLGFFASVIKSGEPWTDTCEREYRSALGNIQESS